MGKFLFPLFCGTLYIYIYIRLEFGLTILKVQEDIFGIIDDRFKIQNLTALKIPVDNFGNTGRQLWKYRKIALKIPVDNFENTGRQHWNNGKIVKPTFLHAIDQNRKNNSDLHLRKWLSFINYLFYFYPGFVFTSCTNQCIYIPSSENTTTNCRLHHKLPVASFLQK